MSSRPLSISHPPRDGRCIYSGAPLRCLRTGLFWNHCAVITRPALGLERRQAPDKGVNP
jgi:hypothetical protein